MSESVQLRLQIEALLFTCTAPMSISQLKQALPLPYSVQQVRQAVHELQNLQNDRAIELIETAQGFRFQTRPIYADLIQRNFPTRPIKLSATLLEIVAAIAYHQPITRAEIEQLRGVSSNSHALRQLFEWQWIKESGHRPVPGKPALLVTTQYFLDAFGLKDLSQLPPYPMTDACAPLSE